MKNKSVVKQPLIIPQALIDDVANRHTEAIKLLPSQVEVRITEDNMGNLLIAPTDPNVEQLIGYTNVYDGCGTLYLQDEEDKHTFLVDYPKARYPTTKGSYDANYQIGKRWYCVNDNATFLIDSWTLRHMIGGQSD